MKVTPSDDIAYYQPEPRAEPSGMRDEWDQLDPGLVWRDRGTPASNRFGDIYFSSEDGLAESRHTFLAGNGLPEAWSGRAQFVIAETGFGTGLNFLATWKTWRETATPNAVLHYLAVEGFPLSREQLGDCLAPWNELTAYSDALLAAYPPVHDGFHRVWFDQGRVALTLMIGEAAEVLAEAEAQVDAWFLDGFAPSRNPEMWSPEVFAEVARLSAPGASLATFTVARPVRQDLAMAGFTLEKRPGYGRKREMLTGRFTGPPSASRIPPWYRPPPPASRRATTAIIGGGIAGCAVASALGRRGISALLIDRHDDVACEASGNPTALISPRIERGGGEAALFHDRAYRMAIAAVETSDLEWQSRGALRLAGDATIPSRLWPGAVTRLDPAAAEECAGITLDEAALWFPEAGLIDPALLARHLMAGAERRFNATATGLEHNGQGWRVRDATGSALANAETLIVAAGCASVGYAPLAWLPTHPVLGQLSRMAGTEPSRALKHTLIWGGYITPDIGDGHVLGATHEHGTHDPSRWPWPVSDVAHRRNYRETPPGIQRLLNPPEAGGWTGRAALRCALPDHLPAAGPVADAEAFTEQFARLRHGPRGAFPTAARHHPGLYVMTGLGGRGITTAILAVELLVCQILGEPWPIERRAALALAPSRFLFRQARHGHPPETTQAQEIGR
jgi:tRNA 5-methylaminomethyl-2-thiouridine biosynthesis bifunctional protein